MSPPIPSGSPAPGEDWRPTASLDALRERARVLARVRAFFAERDVLEVETPMLGSGNVPDPHLTGPTTELDLPGGRRRLWMRTSPELAMKRLVAAGSGPIFEVARVVRDGEAGSRHNPEFTLLEWYRPGWDHHRLIGEVEDLLRVVLGVPTGERRTFEEVFAPLGVDPHRAVPSRLQEVARERGLDVRGMADADRDDWLSLLLTHEIEPSLGRGRPTVVFDFPASQAALARLRRRRDGVEVAERFEVWVEGVELANGYHELTDVVEQRARFVRDRATRGALGLPDVPLDRRFLAALEEGMPACAGVALGFDRLVMMALGTSSIRDVLAFPVDRV